MENGNWNWKTMHGRLWYFVGLENSKSQVNRRYVGWIMILQIILHIRVHKCFIVKMAVVPKHTPITASLSMHFHQMYTLIFYISNSATRFQRFHFDQICSIYLIWRFHSYLKYKENRAALNLLHKECHPPTQFFVILPFHFSWLNWVRKCFSISAEIFELYI